MASDVLSANGLRMWWIYADRLDQKLDACTWLRSSAFLRELGWDVTLVTFGPPDVSSIDGVAVTTIDGWWSSTFMLRQAGFHVNVLAQLLRAWRTTDVILFHSMSAPWLLPLRSVRRILGRDGPQIVMDTRTLPMMPRDKEDFRARLRRVFHLTMERLANGWADGRLAITKPLADSLHIPRRKLWGTWPSGVEVEMFKSARGARVWPSLRDSVELVYIGSLNFERNLMTLSRAVLQANSQGARFRLTLLGDGTERSDLERFASGCDGEVRVLPPVPHSQVPSMLAQAHVGVLVFPDEEKFRVSSPIKLFEYMAAGLPILATRIACHTDVVGDGQYVFWAEGAGIADLTHALMEIWSRRGDLATMGDASAGAASAWTWHESTRKLATALSAGRGGHLSDV